MSNDTLFNSLTRALALEPSAVYDEIAEAYLPVLAATKKRPIISLSATRYPKGGQLKTATVDGDGGRAAFDDGEVVYEYLENYGECGALTALEEMTEAINSAPFPENYLARVVYQPLNTFGLAVRVKAAFGGDQLYAGYSGGLIFCADPVIPSRIVRKALQTAALDRVVAEAIHNESYLAAERHLAGDPVCPELQHIPRGCLPRDVQAAYLSILRDVLATPGYRDEVGDELPELF